MNIRELAKRLSFSKATVSLALRDNPRISLVTRQRVKEEAARCGYTPNPKFSQVMSAISRGDNEKINPPIGVLSNWHWPHAWTAKDANLGRYYDGCSKRAKELGYRLEEFWLNAPGMTAARMQVILETRGIEGVLVFNYQTAPAVLTIDFSPFSSAVIGRALVRPRLSAIDNDHHQSMFTAIEKIKKHGYKIPGLILGTDSHERTLHCWETAYEYSMVLSFLRKPVPVCYIDKMSNEDFRSWFNYVNPDVLMVNDPHVVSLLKAYGVAMPRDVGLVTLFWRRAEDGLAGIDTCDEQIGARAIEVIVEQIRNNSKGVSNLPETILLDGVWRDGDSLPYKKSRRLTRRSTGLRVGL